MLRGGEGATRRRGDPPRAAALSVRAPRSLSFARLHRQTASMLRGGEGATRRSACPTQPTPGFLLHLLLRLPGSLSFRFSGGHLFDGFDHFENIKVILVILAGLEDVRRHGTGVQPLRRGTGPGATSSQSSKSCCMGLHGDAPEADGAGDSGAGSDSQAADSAGIPVRQGLEQDLPVGCPFQCYTGPAGYRSPVR